MTDALTEKPWETTRTNFDRNLAVVIGIDQYQSSSIHDLRTAVSDAQAIADLLEKEYGYAAQNILRLFPPHVVPTLDTLRKVLTDTLPTQLQPTLADRLIFYFAGHGLPLNSDEGPAGYLVPQDAQPGDKDSFLSMREVQKALNQLECHHLLVILDCCFAGTFRWAGSRKAVPILETIRREHYDHFIRYPVWQVITSAAHDQEALDFVKLENDQRGAIQVGQDLHSPFAVALLEGLHKRKADLVQDGVMTVHELFVYLQNRVSELSGRRQAPGLYPLRREYDRGEFVFTKPGFNPAKELPFAPELNEQHNPYRGLAPFDEKHAEFFFGREALIEQLIQKLLQPNQALIVILGVSGAGKSSLVKAGLLPQLRQQNKQWHVLDPMRPGELPLIALARTLQSIASELSVEQLAGQLQHCDYLRNLLQAWSESHPHTKLLLVVDQLEELITMGHAEHQQCFLNGLQAAVISCSQFFRVVVTLRSDFEPRFLESPLQTSWNCARFPVRAMNSDELRSAIEYPALKQALYFDPDNLVTKLIEEVGQMPGALPLLSFTLSELYIKLHQRWKHDPNSTDRAMRMQDYLELGGVAGALTRRATAEYEAQDMNDALQATMRRVMLRMVAIAGGGIVRRQVTQAELTYPEPEENERVAQVISRLTKARLLVTGQETGEPYVEPAHDFLVRGWSKLQEWIKENQEDIALQQRLTPAANDWKKGQGMLWTEETSRLVKLESVLNSESEDNWLNQVETEFVRRSLKARQNRKVKAELQDKAAIVKDLLPVQPLDALVLAIEAMGQNLAELPEEILSSVQISLHQAMKTARIAHTFKGHEGNVLTVAYSPSGEQIASGGTDRTIRLWNLQGDLVAPPFRGHQETVTSIAFSPDGTMIASGSGNQKSKDSFDNTIRLWNLQGDLLVSPFQGHREPITSIIFSPNGKLIASASFDNTIRLWNLKGKLVTSPFQGHNESITCVAFSPDGEWIISSSWDRTICLWDLQGNLMNVFQGHENGITSVAFSPDGESIVSGSDDNTVRLWDLQGNIIGKPFQGHTDRVTSVTFSSNGRLIISGSCDDTIRLWNLDGSSIGEPLRGHESAITSVASSFNNQLDTQLIISGSYDDTVCLWNWKLQDDVICQLEGHQEAITSVAFSPNSQLLVSSSWDNTIRLWNLQGNTIAQLQGHEGVVTSVAFSPNGQLIVSGSEDNTVRLWDLDGNLIRKFQGMEGVVTSIAFSPDGELIASSSGANIVSGGTSVICLWNLQGDLITEPFWGHDGNVSSVAFSPDGKLIASGGSSTFCMNDNTIRLWSLDGTVVGELNGHEESVTSVAFSPDGKLIASGSEDQTVRLWDLDGNSVRQPFHGHEGCITSISFSPDGQTIVSGSEDGTIRLWNRNGNMLSQPFRRHQGGVTSVSFSPDDQMIVSGSSDKTICLWHSNKAWLQICCNRLRHHSAFNSPQTETQRRACKTCQIYV